MTVSTKCMDIFKAISTNDIHLLKYLLKSGCNVNTLRNTFSTPLHETIFQENLEMTKLLLDNPYGEKARVDIKNYFMDEPLFCCKNNPKLAEALLDAGANLEALNSNDETPLIHSIVCWRFKTAHLFIDRGANVNAVDIFNRTPLYEAVSTSDTKLVEKLIEKGANVNAQNNRGNTPLHNALLRKHCVGNIMALLKNGANPNILNNSKESPLKVAFYNRNVEAIRVLFEKGANPKI